MAKTYILKVAMSGKVVREEFDAADALAQLQAAVGGGYIERVPVPTGNGHDLFVDDEGLLMGLPENGVLTRFAYHMTRHWQSLVGDGVFAGHDGEGETVGLSEAECADLEKVLGRCGAEIVGAEAAR